jgi:hypothetical protein
MFQYRQVLVCLRQGDPDRVESIPPCTESEALVRMNPILLAEMSPVSEHGGR